MRDDTQPALIAAISNSKGGSSDWALEEQVDKNINLWKMMVQCFAMSLLPFLQCSILQFFGSHCPSFASFRNNAEKRWWVYFLNFCFDYVLLIVPITVMFATYNMWMYICVGVTTLLHVLFLVGAKGRNWAAPVGNERAVAKVLGPRKYIFLFLDYMVTLTFLIGCFAVQFSDVSVFPDELGKTFESGIGFMDLGSGLILFTTGVTARQARGKSLGAHLTANSPLWKRLKEAFVLLYICFIVGIVRFLIAVLLKGGDRSHGLHWNIFLIIVSVMLIGLFVPNCLLDYSYYLALGIMILYQVGLSYGLQDYARDHNSGSLFHSNIRGFVQTIGYFACYLVGLGVGRKLYRIDYSQPSPEKYIYFEFIKLLLGAGTAFLVSFFFVAPTSPGTCNFTYVSYVVVNVSYYCTIILLFERTCGTLWPNLIMDGPSRTSRLIYFVVANLLTGLINKIVDVGQESALFGLCVSSAYMIVLQGLFSFLAERKIPIRFW